MQHELSAHSEQYLEQIVAGGLFPSKEAALEAAVDALREKTDQAGFVPDEHTEAVDEGLEEANAGMATPMTQDDWDQLRQVAYEVAAQRASRD